MVFTWYVASPGLTQGPAVSAPTIVGPICPDQSSVIVSNTSSGATLALRINNLEHSHSVAGPGDVSLGIAPPTHLAVGDIIQVSQRLGGSVAASNTILVGCTDILTYHNDPQRTGWNQSENTLTAANVTLNSFGLVAEIELDDQVDAQPLVVTGQTIQGFGTRNVVYVVTESNSVYGLDAWSGEKLVSTNLGQPVQTPLGCDNNAKNVGITGTPVIDKQSQTLYVIAYTLEQGQPTYKLHALDLNNLKERPGSPRVVSASQKLNDQTDFPFNAMYQRHRAGLLLANGNIYAGFASFCDFEAKRSRGWVLGWNAGSLAALSTSALINKRADTAAVDCTYPGNHPCFLSSVWMSGYGLAADPEGNIFFTTGNTAPGTYDKMLNIGESAVKMSGNLTVLDLFTPANAKLLDINDTDYGSGGILVLPDMAGEALPHLAVAAGKDGRLFILNRDALGGFHSPDIPQNVSIDHCLCGPSFFEGADGRARVATSGGHTLRTWIVDTSQSPQLQLEASAPIAVSSQPGGFFTSISSNGKLPNTAIIWAVSRPVEADKHVTLYAFDAVASKKALTPLWSDVAGYWPHTGGSSNIVPSVANGMVYVASDRRLRIFGLKRPQLSALLVTTFEGVRAEAAAEPISGPSYWGTVQKIDGNRLLVELRTGRMLQVDVTPAVKAGRARTVTEGQPVRVTGSINANGVFEANFLWRAPGRSLWGEDRAQ
ncbi:MAG: hypothetical protein C5B58_16420 [Acidobacteria bacterium]|nr:MAG: hypothetical protein C5B58_16420 [Acidobacteriota bacterium]